MRVVPDLGRQLVTADVAFELLLVVRAVEDQIVRARIADAVAENEIETEPHLVDEVIHIAFQTAVVIAGEVEALSVVDEHPSREMDRAHAGEAAARVEVPRAPLHCRQTEADVQQPEGSRLQ